jgi:hypothetical protein
MQMSKIHGAGRQMNPYLLQQQQLKKNQGSQVPPQSQGPQFTGSTSKMQLPPQNAFSNAAFSATGFNPQRVQGGDSFTARSGPSIGQTPPRFGAVTGSEGPPKNNFQGSQNVQDQLAAFRQQVTFRGPNSAPYNAGSQLYIQA